MKNVAKVVMLSLVVLPLLAGCAKKCHEPVCHKVENVKKECGGK